MVYTLYQSQFDMKKCTQGQNEFYMISLAVESTSSQQSEK